MIKMNRWVILELALCLTYALILCGCSTVEDLHGTTEITESYHEKEISNTESAQQEVEEVAIDQEAENLEAVETVEATVPVTSEDTAVPQKIGYIETDFEGAELTGSGTYIWENGDTYIGQWVDGIENGEGEYHWVCGDVFTGEFKNGLPEGNGEVNFANGQSYIGYFSQGEYEGEGQFIFPNIGSYTGHFTKSERSGYGTFTWDTGEKYEGNWIEDKINGYGKYTTADGAVHQGQFVDGILSNGQLVNQVISGTYTISKDNSVENKGEKMTVQFSDYSRYEGEVKDDTFHGEGKFTMADGSILDGVFSNGKFISGKFTTKINYNTLTFSVDKGTILQVEIKYSNGTTYTGGYKDGNINGKGKMTYSNGDVYEGEFVNGSKEGTGTYTWTWQGGAYYTGEWKNDTMNGNGTYYYPSWASAVKLVGKFKDGKPEGSCEYYTTATKHYRTDWKKGAIAKIYE